jgi:HEAT repeat protein
LLAIARNTDEDQTRRLYAADSLGKIGDARALPVLRDMFAEQGALVRAYAASSLARFSIDEVFPDLLAGLKDENEKVRTQCALALARSLSDAQAVQAVPALAYKARYDPSSVVRVQAIKSLGAIAVPACLPVLQSLFTTSSTPVESRSAALTALVAHWLAESLPAIRQVIADGLTLTDQRILEVTAAALTDARDPGLKDIYASLLGSRSYAARYSALQGIGANKLSELKDQVQKAADTDPIGSVKQMAKTVLSGL